MKDKIKELIDKFGVKKIAIIGAIIVITIVGTVVGVSALKPVNEVVEEDKNKDKNSDIDKEEADEKTEDTETKEDVTQEVVEEETSQVQTETAEDTTSITTGNTNSNSTTNNTTTTTPFNNTSNNNANNNSSANQNTQTQTPTTPTANTWFDKMGFEITPWTSSLCYSDVAGHTCDSNFTICETTDFWNCGAGQKTVMMTHNHFCDCFNDYSFLPIDRYTGKVLEWSTDFVEFVSNGKTISVWGARGTGDGVFENVVVCPADYDGVIFALVSDWEFPDNYNPDVELYTLDKFADLDTAKYYFFSYSNK